MIQVPVVQSTLVPKCSGKICFAPCLKEGDDSAVNDQLPKSQNINLDDVKTETFTIEDAVTTDNSDNLKKTGDLDEVQCCHAMMFLK